MKLLAIDSSAKCASVAVVEDGRLLSECFVNVSLTHSQTLMPMTDNALKQAMLKINDIDRFCVNVGPGSFTGIRIGVAAVKGLAHSLKKPCAGISTLESMAYNFVDDCCIVCAVMDARCNQVYNALFKCEKGQVERLCEDRALPIDELSNELCGLKEKIILAGDGAELCYDLMKDKIKNIVLPCENRRYQRAYGTAMASMAHEESFKAPELLVPVYLRPPQAERELKLKKETENK